MLSTLEMSHSTYMVQRYTYFYFILTLDNYSSINLFKNPTQVIISKNFIVFSIVELLDPFASNIWLLHLTVIVGRKNECKLNTKIIQNAILVDSYTNNNICLCIDVY